MTPAERAAWNEHLAVPGNHWEVCDRHCPASRAHARRERVTVLVPWVLLGAAALLAWLVREQLREVFRRALATAEASAARAAIFGKRAASDFVGDLESWLRTEHY